MLCFENWLKFIFTNDLPLFINSSSVSIEWMTLIFFCFCGFLLYWIIKVRQTLVSSRIINFLSKAICLAKNCISNSKRVLFLLCFCTFWPYLYERTFSTFNLVVPKASHRVGSFQLASCATTFEEFRSLITSLLFLKNPGGNPMWHVGNSSHVLKCGKVPLRPSSHTPWGIGIPNKKPIWLIHCINHLPIWFTSIQIPQGSGRDKFVFNVWKSLFPSFSFTVIADYKWPLFLLSGMQNSLVFCANTRERETDWPLVSWIVNCAELSHSVTNFVHEFVPFTVHECPNRSPPAPLPV